MDITIERWRVHWYNGHYNRKIESIYIGLMDIAMERLRVYTLV